MGRQLLGRPTCTAFLAAVCVVLACGCQTSSPLPTADSRRANVRTAVQQFQEAFDGYTVEGCPSSKPDTCWDQMQALVKPARQLRKTMQADTTAPAGRWDGAYALISKMEAGVASGKDRGDLEYGDGDDPEVTLPSSNRPAVFGSARKLSTWLQEHPAS